MYITTSLSGSSDSRISSWAINRLATRVVDRRAQEDDAVVREPRVRIPLHATARRVLDEPRHRDVLVSRLVTLRTSPREVLLRGLLIRWLRLDRLMRSRLRRGIFGDREVDHVPFLVDHRCVLDEELERLPPGKIRAYRLQHAPPFEVAPHLFGLLLEPLGEALDLGVDLVVGRLDRFLRDDRAEREIGEHRPCRHRRGSRR